MRGGRILPLLTLFVLLAACGNDLEKIHLFDDRTTPPDNVIRSAHVQHSSSGSLQLVMDAPLIERYSTPSPRTEYPQGVWIQFFSGAENPTATLSARYAVQYDDRDVTLVRDSVVIIDLRSHDTTYLKDLTWDANQHRIYSESPIRSVNGLRVTLGDGFESDDAMQSPQILHQRGTVQWNED